MKCWKPLRAKSTLILNGTDIKQLTLFKIKLQQMNTGSLKNHLREQTKTNSKSDSLKELIQTS